MDIAAPKKIVRIIARLNVGGPAIHTVLLSSELNRRGYRDILVCGMVNDSEGDMSYLAAEKNVAPVIIKDMSREISPIKDIRAFFSILSVIKREKPDIVHTHTAKAGTLGRLAAICAGVPVKVHTFHGHVFDGYFNPVKARIFLMIEKFLAIFTDRVVTVSGLIRDEIVNKLKVVEASKCVVIPLGFELDRFLTCEKERGAFRKELGVGPDTLLVGIVGRLVPIKNHGMFIDAAADFIGRDRLAKVNFVIIGDGECAADLKEKVKRAGLDGRVIFTGWKKDLAPVYADLDVVVLTSLNEGTPVSLIEASACARPVVATDVGGVRDIVIHGKNGFLVNSDDAKDLSRKLADLLADGKKRAEFGLNGRELVRAKYSKERLVNDIESLYKECFKK
ncbi:MAG: glycosyltransferase family 4 protein [Candidatus Omnitrophica bacterium]|nr:glycosyltransferase family 4 protein [Candidatus Omnitrophota bacterium]